MNTSSSFLALAAALSMAGAATTVSQAATPASQSCQMPTASVLMQKVAGFNKSQYSGYVGRMYAEFELTWSDNGDVAGTYTYPGNRGTIYLLKGGNPREGVLVLEEYTGNDLTATIRLRKSMDGDQVVWTGTMKNTDGRQFPVEIRRTGAR